MSKFTLDSLKLSEFDLDESCVSQLDERTIVIKRWNWEYFLGHKFQRHALQLVQEVEGLRILICCSHPEVLTNGRGLQKPRKGEELNLVAFNPSEHFNLPYPLFQIERGGGLTFHHPGQFIFYPIVKLNPKSLSLSLMINQIFDFSVDVLKGWDVNGLNHENKLLGLWCGNQKLASMGLAIEKLTTFHGMALNIIDNPHMKIALAKLNPCGLTADTYTAVDKLTNLPSNPIDTFCDGFLQRIKDEWK